VKFYFPKNGQLRNKQFVILTIVVVLGLCAIGLIVHQRTHRSGITVRGPATLPSAAVVRVKSEDLYKEVTIPAEFRPYVEVELHAKVSGYVDKMNVDFGDKVKSGQVLATLMVPELQDELHNAIATEQKAEADYTNANLEYTRLLAVNKQHPNLVAQQDLDTAAANDQMAAAEIAAAKADAGKYRTLVSYTQITAPFDGVVTWRYADPGALIQAGTSSDSQSLPLVRVSDNYLLRLDFPVSVEYVHDMHVDDPVNVRVDSLGSKMFQSKITRFTQKVDEDTRTMMVETEMPNTNLEITPGMYATVIFKSEIHPNTLAIPIEAVTGDKNNIVFVVNQNGEIEERTVTLGIETPAEYEVLSGLKEGETVMVGNPRRLQPGQKVEAIAASLPGEQ
jgi:RND family efflux transporter MFP subunit